MMDKQTLLNYWAGELVRVKAQLIQVSQLLNMGVTLTREQESELDRLLDQRKRLEALIEEFKSK